GRDTSFFGSRDVDRVRIQKATRSRHDVDMVPQQLVSHDIDLSVNDPPRTHAKIVDRDLLLHPVALAIRRPLAETGEIDDRLTKRLRRNRPPVDRDAADLAALDDGDATAELRRLDRGLLACRPGADHE